MGSVTVTPRDRENRFLTPRTAVSPLPQAVADCNHAAMFTHWKQAIVVGPLLFALATESHADSYRCGRKLVRTGDAAARVLRLCGEPTARQRGAAPKAGISGSKGRVELWFYRRSPRSLEHVIRIQEGRVLSIDVVGR